MLAYLIITVTVGAAAAVLCIAGLRRKDTYQVLQALVLMMVAAVLATPYGVLNSM
ncbi:MAG: hypothetical protein ABI140_01555 [Jatrophihabitantaceae bacterium]